MEEYAQSRLCVVAPIEFCHHGQRLMWLVGRSMLQGRGPMSRLRERGGSRKYSYREVHRLTIKHK